jgi:rRNA maturation RNase YbeY
MSIFYHSAEVPFPKINKRKTTTWINKVIANHNKNPGPITFIFCSDEEILKINKQFLKHNYYTDIITFDYSEGDKLSGDLFISLETVKTNSEKYKTGYEDELHRVMIHGILHLCGFNDKTPEEKIIMTEKENDALSLFD